jgi:hypothetical protein
MRRTSRLSADSASHEGDYAGDIAAELSLSLPRVYDTQTRHERQTLNRHSHHIN